MNDDQFPINRKEWEFEFGQRDVHPALMTDLWLRAIRDYMPSEIKLPIKAPDYLFTAAYKGYIKSSDKKDILEKISKASEEREYQQYVFKRTLGVIEEFDQVVDEIMGTFTPDISKEALLQSWGKIDKKYVEMVPWFWIPWYLTEENVLANRVKEGLENYREKIDTMTDFNTAVGALLFPLDEATYQEEQRDFFALVKMAKSDEGFRTSKEFAGLSEMHLQKYDWMKTYFLLPIEPLTNEELLRRVEEALPTNLLEEYELQTEKKKEYENLAKSLIASFVDDKELIQTIEDARELGAVLMVSVENGIRASAKLLPFLKVVAKNIDVEYKHLIHLRSDEIIGMLKGIKKVSNDEILERVAGNAALMIDGNIRWMWGEEAKQFTEWIEAGVGVLDTNITEFKGQPAFKGKVTGKVRIALTPDEARNLIDGEILVTSMTSPDYVPAMRKASAIVTSEGGLLSHAAIMSREFGKPCIVGTKIATKVLKTGDMIEVDAEKGIVTIL